MATIGSLFLCRGDFAPSLYMNMKNVFDSEFHRFKAGYKENPELLCAMREPHTCVPDIQGPIKIDESCRFLILMSSGIAQCFKAKRL